MFYIKRSIPVFGPLLFMLRSLLGSPLTGDDAAQCAADQRLNLERLLVRSEAALRGRCIYPGVLSV